jgi:hypothetical protein
LERSALGRLFTGIVIIEELRCQVLHRCALETKASRILRRAVLFFLSICEYSLSQVLRKWPGSSIEQFEPCI